MHLKQRQLPLEVSSWIQKDVKLNKLTSTSNSTSSDVRQNVVLNRQFFAETLNLSFARYRMMTKHDFDKKLFLRNQRSKAETSLPGLRPFLDEIANETSFCSPSRATSSRKNGEQFFSSSSQSLAMSRSIVKSDATSHASRGPTLLIARPSKTPQPAKVAPIPSPASPTPTPSPTPIPRRTQMSRERLSRLAQPRGQHIRPTEAHIRPNGSDTQPTARGLFGKIDEASEVSTARNSNNSRSGPPPSASRDKRFRRLMHLFAETYERTSTTLPTVKSIVSANTSLQDNEGRWQMTSEATASRNAEDGYRRRMLGEQFESKTDFFWIDVGA